MSCAPYDLKCSVRYDSGNTQTYVMRTTTQSVPGERNGEAGGRLRLTLPDGLLHPFECRPDELIRGEWACESVRGLRPGPACPSLASRNPVL